MMRVFLIALMSVSLSGCLMNWYHPFFSEYTKSTKKQLVEQGDAQALYEMGEAWCCGPKGGGQFDTEKAMSYWCQAAKKGHSGAQLALGKLYENSYRMIGNTIPKNDLKAYMWYSVAEAAGNAEAGMVKRYLEQSMVPENLERAKAMIPHWRETRCVLLESPQGPWNPEWVAEQEAAAKKSAAKNFAAPQPANTRPRRR